MSTNNNPVVSVIVPARNEEACLASCLESLVSQTGIDFEIIVVDDASTDRTAEIARSFLTLSASTDGEGTTSSRGAEDITLPARDESLANHSTVSEQRKGASFATAESRALSEPTDPTTSCPSTRQTEAHIPRPIAYVISAPQLLDDWTGKNNAMAAGAKIAKGKWLLFTDADTVHKPGSLVRAVAEAEEHGAALLSYSPEQEVRTFWEIVVMPVIFAELAATYPPKKVNDPASPIAAANGQYLLISREAYDVVGGHTKIASDLLEDVAMARLVKSSRRRIFFRYGGDAVRTRMYRDWGQMKEGWTKNLALLFPNSRTLALFRGIEFLLIVGNVTAASVAIWARSLEIASVTSILAALIAVSFFGRIRRAHFSLTSNLVALGGLAIFSYLLFRSAALHRNRVVTWKGRRYGGVPALMGQHESPHASSEGAAPK